jgi:S1-C subfamily serine protease
MVMGEMSASYLGVDIDEVTSDRVSALKLKEERGVEVTEVDQDAPAGKAGLREHDVIVEFNGQRVEGREQFTRFIRETPSGRTVTLGIMRDGQPMQIRATLADRKDEWAKNNKFKYNDRVRVMPAVPPMPPMPDVDVEIPQFEITTVVASSTGVSVEPLTSQLAQFFGVRSGSGILVKSVEKGSAAEKAGIKAGDVIVKVDNESIERSSDYRQAIRHRRTETVKVTVVRNKAEQIFNMTLPTSRRDSSRLEDLHSDDQDLDFDFDFDFDPEIEVAGNGLGHFLEIKLNNLGEQIEHNVNHALNRLEVDSH